MEFERDLVCSIAEFIRAGATKANGSGGKNDDKMTVVGTCSTYTERIRMSEDDANNPESAGTSELREIQSPPLLKAKKRVKFIVPERPKIDREAMEELQELMEAREAGIAYISGHSYVRAKRGSNMIKKAVLNIGYELLRTNSRPPTFAVSVAQAAFFLL